jgi:hypothetical protein
MIDTDFLNEKCNELFSDYPLAVTPVNQSRTTRSMILMSGEGYDAKFFVLSQDCREDQPFYSLRPWPADYTATVEIRAAAASGVDIDVVTCSVPIPRHGSLLGWAYGNHITALVAVYAKYTPASPEPYWAVMPLAGSSETLWPPFTDECFFGRWFWEHYKAGSVRSLSDLIAGVPSTVFWIDTKAILGSDCCAVARDIRSPEGYTLRCGRYVYYQVLRAGKPVPSLRTLLACTDRIDLASRFRQPEHTMLDRGLGVRSGHQEQRSPVSTDGKTSRSRLGEKSRFMLFARFRHTAQRWT